MLPSRLNDAKNASFLFYLFSLSAFQTQGLFLGFNHFNQDLQQYLWLPCLSTTSGKAKCPHFRAKLFAAWCLAILANCMDPHPKHVAISTQKPQDSMLIDLPIHDDPDHSPSCGRDCSSLCSSKLRDDVHRTSSTLQLNPSSMKH